MPPFDEEDPRPGYAVGSETSRMAAERHRPRRIMVAWQVWEAVMERSGTDHVPRGMTANEACNLFNDKGLNTVSARFTDLSQSNCILLTNMRRLTDKESWAEVYVTNPNATMDFFKEWLKERNRLKKLLAGAEGEHAVARRVYVDAYRSGLPSADLLQDMIQTATVLRDIELDYDHFLLTCGCPGGTPVEPGQPPPFVESPPEPSSEPEPETPVAEPDNHIEDWNFLLDI